MAGRASTTRPDSPGCGRSGWTKPPSTAASATRPTSFVTGIVDLSSHARGPAGGPARLRDVIADRSGSALVNGMSAGDPGWRARIGVAALDPFRGYAAALRASPPHAVRVRDAFPVVRWGFAAVDQVRRRIPQELTGHRGRRGDPLWTRLLAGLDAGDTPDEQLAKTWIAAQELRLLYRCPDRTRAEQHLYAWLGHCADSGVPELERLARTIDSWRTELLAYFDTGGVSHGPTEAINLLVKKIKRVGHGFRNFDNYRLRLLLHCGTEWDTIRATPIRGRLPRLAA